MSELYKEYKGEDSWKLTKSRAAKTAGCLMEIDFTSSAAKVLKI